MDFISGLYLEHTEQNLVRFLYGIAENQTTLHLESKGHFCISRVEGSQKELAKY